MTSTQSTRTQHAPANATGRQTRGRDPAGIEWHVAPGGTWLGSRGPYTCRIAPDGRGRNTFESYRVSIYRRGTRAPLAITDARTVTLAKSWLTSQIAQIAARAPPQAPPVKTTFEVALHRDTLDAGEIMARLTRRMQAEARRLGLVNPRRVSTIIDTSLAARPAEVWVCRGDVA